jgi:hypothetical protein
MLVTSWCLHAEIEKEKQMNARVGRPRLIYCTFFKNPTVVTASHTFTNRYSYSTTQVRISTNIQNGYLQVPTNR